MSIQKHPITSCDVVSGESRELSEHMNCHKQVPTEDEQTILHKFLRLLAVQQEVIINKLQKLKNTMETDLPEVKTQQQALRLEVSEALKVIHDI